MLSGSHSKSGFTTHFLVGIRQMADGNGSDITGSLSNRIQLPNLLQQSCLYFFIFCFYL